MATGRRHHTTRQFPKTGQKCSRQVGRQRDAIDSAKLSMGGNINRQAIAETKRQQIAEQERRFTAFKKKIYQFYGIEIQISYVHISAGANIHSSARQKGINPRNFFLRTKPRSQGGAVRSTKPCGKKEQC